MAAIDMNNIHVGHFSQAATVLLATCNGAKWLDAQLASIEQQSWPVIHLWASDDGSTDDTPAILRAWQMRWRKGQFVILSGPRDGFSRNFRHLVLSTQGTSALYAFSDQDDIWLPGKLEAAAAAIGQVCTPALYCGRTIIADSDGAPMHPSKQFRAPPSFQNALVQSIAGGNTMVMNPSAFTLVREAMSRAVFVSHDWFCYQIVSGSGGKVHYSPEPQVLYRQHDANLVGSNHGMRARLHRLGMILNGRFSRWNETNIIALRACQSLLTPDAVLSLYAFQSARRTSAIRRILYLKRSGVFRQTIFGQISLYFSCFLGKI